MDEKEVRRVKYIRDIALVVILFLLVENYINRGKESKQLEARYEQSITALKEAIEKDEKDKQFLDSLHSLKQHLTDRLKSIEQATKNINYGNRKIKQRLDALDSLFVDRPEF